MDAALDFILKRMMHTAKELFDGTDEFMKFERDADSGSRSGTHSVSISGKLVYRRGDEIRHSPPLFLKVSPDVRSFELVSLILYMNEVFFYSKIEPYLGHLRPTHDWLPKFHVSHLEVSTQQTKEILVFEDLAAKGFLGCRLKGCSLDLEHLSLMLRKLGQFHAYSYKARACDSRNFDQLTSSLKNLFSLVAKDLGSRLVQRWKIACEPLREEPKYKRFIQNLDRILGNFEEHIVEAVKVVDEDEPLGVLCHCSFTRENVLFKYAGERPVDLVILDWQTCELNLPGLDVLLVLYVSADQRTRDEHWHSLLEEYHRGLSETFPELSVPGVNKLMKNMEGRLALVLLVAGYRIPHPSFSVRGKNNCCKPASVDGYADPLTDVLKDMIDRGLLG